jgi:hypothetical protein
VWSGISSLTFPKKVLQIFSGENSKPKSGRSDADVGRWSNGSGDLGEAAEEKGK